MSEESGFLGDSDQRPVVLIDPVDGNTNASMGIPMYSTAMAIATGEYFDDVVASGIIDLVRGEIIYCEKGSAPIVNGKGCKLAVNADPKNAVISLDIRLNDIRGQEGEDVVKKLIKTIRYPRLLGSAALETAYVAIGRLNACVESIAKLRSFDCLPSLFMIKEAGGCLKFLNKNKPDMKLTGHERYSYVAASSETLCAQLVRFFEDYQNPR